MLVTCLLYEVGQCKCCDGRVFCWFDDDTATSSQGRSRLPSDHGQRKIPLQQHTATITLSRRPAQVSKKQVFKYAKDTIVKIVSNSRCRKTTEGIRIRLENNFFPHCKQQKPIFSKKNSQEKNLKCRQWGFKGTLLKKPVSRLQYQKTPKGYHKTRRLIRMSKFFFNSTFFGKNRSA